MIVQVVIKAPERRVNADARPPSRGEFEGLRRHLIKQAIGRYLKNYVNIRISHSPPCLSDAEPCA